MTGEGAAAAPPAGPAVAEGRREALLVAAAAVFACAPAWSANAAAYMDNAPHLFEAWALSTHILPEDGWYTGWSELAGVGMPIGLLNAPLAWVGLALAHRAGVPLEGGYAALLTASNVVFGLALLALGRRLLGDSGAATVGALLGVAYTPDVWGVGGLAGGMWPYRLGVGLLLLELARAGAPRSVAERALLGAATILSHLFASIFWGIWVVIRLATAAREGDRRELGATLQGAALAVGLSAFYLVPLRDGSVRDFSFLDPVAWPPLQLLGVMFTNVEGIVLSEGPIPTVGGVAGALVPALVVAGVGWGLARGQLGRPRGLPLQVTALVLVVSGLALGLLLTRSLALGPVPWRYFAVLRAGLCLLAAPGLVLLVRSGAARVGLALLTVGASVWTGRVEVPPLVGQAATDWSAYEEAMRVAAASRQGGAVFVEDPWKDEEAPPSLRNTHVGALLPIRTGAPAFGAWYGVVPDRLNVELASELGSLLGMPQASATPEKVARRLRIYGAGAALAVSERLARLLGDSGEWTEVGRFGAMSVWTSREPPLPLAGLPPGEGEVTGIDARRGEIAMRVTTSAPATVRVRQAWHSWWEARLDGAPVPLERDPRSGLVSARVPASGTLELRWQARDRGLGGAISLAAAVLVGLVALAGRRTAAARPR